MDGQDRDKEMITWQENYDREGREASEYGAANKLELRKIVFVERMSEETNCFTAFIYKDGKNVGEAHNDGHGGDTYAHMQNMTEQDHKHLTRWADDQFEKWMHDKATAKLEKWIAKHAAANKYRCFNTAVVYQGVNVSLVPTKLTTEEEFRQQYSKYKTAEKIEIRR